MNVKRLIDIIIAGLGLFFLLPFFAVLALLVRVFMGAPILFRQERPGFHGQPFTLIKFRSLRESGKDGKILTDAERMPRFGRWLRASSLDELPELWNVIRGEMSIVGPRPLLMEYLPLYSPEQNRRHDVRPGLTGGRK